jgi:hypothetical protein
MRSMTTFSTFASAFVSTFRMALAHRVPGGAVLAALLALPLAARTQPVEAPQPPVIVAADCPRSADELVPEMLYGRWEARFDDAPAPVVLRLARHPEYAGSVRGTLARPGGPGADAQVAGDIDDAGVLTLDESADGRAIDAVWSADLEPGSCGQAFRGTRRDARDDSIRTFVLHKTGELP